MRSLCVLLLLGVLLIVELGQAVDVRCVCGLDYHPVCGSDGETYANKCLLKCEAKQKKNGLKMKKNGPCQDLPVPDEESGEKQPAVPPSPATPTSTPAPDAKQKKKCACPRILMPVCGSDHETYNNLCLLKCEAANKKDLVKIDDGPCRDKRDADTDVCKCPKNYKPVCGSDGKTYKSQCLLNCETKKTPSLGTVSQGKCKTKTRKDKMNTCKCVKTKKPVCGSDGKTYNNVCLLKCAQKVDSTLTKVSKGPCRVLRAAEEFACMCPAIYAPICGSDGKTYSNNCEIECEKKVSPELQQVHPGACLEKREVSERPPCACTRMLMLVCGSNNQTYQNPCLLKCDKKTKNMPDLVVQSAGPCPGDEHLLEE